MKKNLIDKVLLEWSYRCEDGIPDMNNPKKLNILKEMLGIDSLKLKEQEIPLDSANIKRDISNLLDDIDINSEEGQQLVKSIYNKIKNIKYKNKNLNDLEKIFKEKNLTSLEKDIYYTAYEFDEVKEFIDYLKSPSLSYDDLTKDSSFNFISLAKAKSNLSENFIKSLLNRNATLRGTSVGRGEIAIVLLTKDAKKNLGKEDEKGDISIDSKILEIKASAIASDGGNVGFSMATSKRNPRDSSISKDVKDWILKQSEKEENQKQLKLTLEQIESKVNWITRLRNFYVEVFSVNKKIKEDITNFLKEEIYKNLDIKNLDSFFTDKNGDKILQKEIAIALAKEYLESFKNILEINVANGNCIFIDSSNIESLIQSEKLKIVSFSDKAPRLYYNG